MLETNVLALLVGCQAAVRAMRACKAEGHIVNVSSIAAQRADSGVYGATKHAVTCISHTLRRELEEDSIRVVDVRPGAIATKVSGASSCTRIDQGGLMTARRRNASCARGPSSRPASPSMRATLDDRV